MRGGRVTPMQVTRLASFLIIVLAAAGVARADGPRVTIDRVAVAARRRVLEIQATGTVDGAPALEARVRRGDGAPPPTGGLVRGPPPPLQTLAPPPPPPD